MLHNYVCSCNFVEPKSDHLELLMLLFGRPLNLVKNTKTVLYNAEFIILREIKKRSQ